MGMVLLVFPFCIEEAVLREGRNCPKLPDLQVGGWDPNAGPGATGHPPLAKVATWVPGVKGGHTLGDPELYVDLCPCEFFSLGSSSIDIVRFLRRLPGQVVLDWVPRRQT